MATDQSKDETILRDLNDAYIHSDQNSDVARYDEFLADDFTASLPDLVFRNRQEFLDLIAQPRPFRDLTLRSVQVRILGDVALLHGRGQVPGGPAEGVGARGTLPPDFAAQAENAWDNVKRALETAAFALSDLVKVSTSVTSADDIAPYKDIRRKALGDLKPAFMLTVVPSLINPRILIEIEAWAARPVDADD